MNPEEIKYHFYKMHDDAFGYGYGSGEQSIIPLLKQFVTIAMSNDGTYDFRELEQALGDSNTWLLINALCRINFVEYGSSPRFAWIDHEEKTRAIANFIVTTPTDELYDIAMMDYEEASLLEDKYEAQ